MPSPQGLTLFARVVRCGSFAEAARQLNLPTTTLSRRIQQLEESLGGRLLNRSTRSLSLTELGERVLPRAQLIEDTLEELKQDAEQLQQEPSGTLHISAPRSMSQHLLSPLLGEFCRNYPTIGLDLDTSNRYQDMARSRLDFAFRVGPLTDSNLIARSLSPIHYVLVASPELLSRLGPLTHPEQLVHWPCMQAHVDGYLLPWSFSSNGQQLVPQLNAFIRCDDMITLARLASEGAGIAYLPVSLVREELMQGRLVSLLEPWLEQRKELFIVYPERRYMAQKSKLFLGFIMEQQSWLSENLNGPSGLPDRVS